VTADSTGLPAEAPGRELERQEVRLRGGQVVEIASREDGALVRLAQGGGDPRAVEIEVAWSADGPVARVRAVRIEVETTADMSLRCKSFQVQAAEGIHLSAGADLKTTAQAVELEARTGRIVARANDDVQLLGEQILLNCDRSPPLPDWVPQAPGLMMGELLALTESSGDPELLATVKGLRDEDGDAPR